MNKLILIIGLSFNFAFANEAAVGRITDVAGAGFISYKGNTKEIRKGDLVYLNSEIVVEHLGRVTYADNYDHKFHLGNSSSLSVTKKGVELRSGDLWLQSLNRNDNYKLNTANAIIDFQNGEGIVTYDSTNGKTQLMVINGMMKFSNLRVPDLNLSVSEGNFSYIDNNYEQGAPRDPTPVGSKTYKELLSLFKGVSPMNNAIAMANGHGENSDKHEASSVMVHESKTEKVIEHQAKREIASVKTKVENKLLEEYKNSLFKTNKKVTKTVSVKKDKATKVIKKDVAASIVHIYGLEKESKVAPKNENRMPASVVESTEAKVERVESNSVKIENEKNLPSKETVKLLEQIKSL